MGVKKQDGSAFKIDDFLLRFKDVEETDAKPAQATETAEMLIKTWIMANNAKFAEAEAAEAAANATPPPETP